MGVLDTKQKRRSAAQRTWWRVCPSNFDGKVRSEPGDLQHIAGVYRFFDKFAKAFTSATCALGARLDAVCGTGRRMDGVQGVGARMDGVQGTGARIDSTSVRGGRADGVTITGGRG